MKRAASIVAGVLVAVLTAGGSSEAKLNAQIGPGEVFSVPFPFTADGHEIDPGTYEVRRDFSQFLMSIQNVKTGEKQLFSVRPESRNAVPSKGLMVFEKCGDRKVLTEFHVRGTSLYSATTGAGLPNSRDMENCSRPETVTLAAR